MFWRKTMILHFAKSPDRQWTTWGCRRRYLVQPRRKNQQPTHLWPKRQETKRSSQRQATRDLSARARSRNGWRRTEGGGRTGGTLIGTITLANGVCYMCGWCVYLNSYTFYAGFRVGGWRLRIEGVGFRTPKPISGHVCFDDKSPEGAAKEPTRKNTDSMLHLYNTFKHV